MKSNLFKKISIFTAGIMVMGTLLIPGSSASASYQVLSQGSRGTRVSNLQRELKNQGFFNHWTITDYYGNITRNAVINFQRNRGLLVDGIAGPQTKTALYGSNRTLLFGMRGPDVVRLQDALRQRGFFHSNSTGYYGRITENAVINFQRSVGIRIDGIAGPQTQSALYGQKKTSSANSTTVATSNTVSASRSSTTTDRDNIFWLARIIHAEAQGEPYIGKVAVGNVIMNRVRSSNFPNSIYGVIFDDYRGIPQFSPTADGTIHNSPNADSLRAAEESYYGSRPVGEALYFFNPAKAAGTWIVNNRRYMTTIGGHAFYY